MHERNIYKTPPNFADLAKKHSFLSPFLALNPGGVAKINFKDQAALRALTQALLIEDFDLKVEIPDDVLVPTVPLRLNYILWLEDLLSYNESFGKVASQIRGFDVGTGATAIYALLGAKKNQWQMTGSEIDPVSVMVARSNVTRNNLQQLIEIRHVKESVLGGVLADSTTNPYDFTMCNPPFFGSDEETISVQKSKREGRPEPSGARSGTKSELVVPGGELEFISQMIEDSKVHRDVVKIFTTMIGIKKHIKDLITKLKTDGIHNFTTTEFCQGKTMRWGLAWSFDSNIHLNPPALVSHTFESVPGCLSFEDYIYAHLSKLNFKCLEKVPTEEDMASFTTCHFIATENTWTGQRRKRRELERQKKLSEEPPPTKRMKISGENDGNGDTGEMEGMDTSPPLPPVLLNSHVQIEREGSRASISMSLLAGSMGKDGLNQIMTYLRNCYNRDSQNPATELHQLLKCEEGK